MKLIWVVITFGEDDIFNRVDLSGDMKLGAIECDDDLC